MRHVTTPSSLSTVRAFCEYSIFVLLAQMSQLNLHFQITTNDRETCRSLPKYPPSQPILLLVCGGSICTYAAFIEHRLTSWAKNVRVASGSSMLTHLCLCRHLRGKRWRTHRSTSLVERWKLIFVHICFFFQHFPLYRESDRSCNDVDSTPPNEIKTFRENYDVLSKRASEEVTHLLLRHHV